MELSSLKTGDIVELETAKLVYGGRALAHLGGEVVFVANALPKERVKARILATKRDYAEAEAIKSLSASPHEAKAFCAHFESCGGCVWQKLDYQAQLSAKKSFVIESLARIAGLRVNDCRIEASEANFYRNRVQLRGTIARSGRLSLGFLQAKTHIQAPIESCSNADTAINAFIAQLLTVQTRDVSQRFRLELQYLPAALAAKKPAMLGVLHPLGKNRMPELCRQMRAFKSAAWVGYYDESKHSPILPFEEDASLLYHSRAGLFQQVNLPMNRLVRKRLREFADDHSIGTVLDLYCGSGNLSLGLADGRRRVLGIDSVAGAIEVARRNVSYSGLEKIEYHQTSSDKGLKNVLGAKANFDLVIVDPPRRGIAEAIDNLLQVQARYICYLSCNPTSLARDIKELASYYELIGIEAFDFFPNTYHVESLAILRRTAKDL